MTAIGQEVIPLLGQPWTLLLVFSTEARLLPHIPLEDYYVPRIVESSSPLARYCLALLLPWVSVFCLFPLCNQPVELCLPVTKQLSQVALNALTGEAFAGVPNPWSSPLSSSVTSH